MFSDSSVHEVTSGTTLDINSSMNGRKFTVELGLLLDHDQLSIIPIHGDRRSEDPNRNFLEYL